MTPTDACNIQCNLIGLVLMSVIDSGLASPSLMFCNVHRRHIAKVCQSSQSFTQCTPASRDCNLQKEQIFQPTTEVWH